MTGAGDTTSNHLLFSRFEMVSPNLAPVADFAFSCTELACAFTDGSTDADGVVSGWSWDFGDGRGSTSRSPSHTYAVRGTYTVALTARDDQGATKVRRYEGEDGHPFSPFVSLDAAARQQTDSTPRSALFRSG